MKDIIHQATVCFALSQSVEQSPKILPCIATTQFGATVRPGVWLRKVGTVAGTGCAAWVVVLRAGANASASITLRSSGQIPEFRNALSIVPGVNALSRACE